MPTVLRVPFGPTVNKAPRGPKESDGPDLLRFSEIPGAIFILLQKRKPILLPPVSRSLVGLPFLAHRSVNLLDFWIEAGACAMNVEQYNVSDRKSVGFRLLQSSLAMEVH